MSQILFPITNNTINTINETDDNTNSGTPVYESLRLQFIIAGETFDERGILRTVALYLKSNLCADKMVDYDGTSFNFVLNNSDTIFVKQKRLYNLYDDFITKCINPMIQNMKDLFALPPVDTPENIEIRSRLVTKWNRLEEFKLFYLTHKNALDMIESLKYYL